MANKKKAVKSKKAAVKKSTVKKKIVKKATTKKIVAQKAVKPKKTATKKMASKKAQPPKKGTVKKVRPALAKAKSQVKAKSSSKANLAPKAVVKPTAKTVNLDYSKAITPLGDRLVVRLIAKEAVTAGGLIIPDTVSQPTGFYRAEVLAAGVGKKNKKGNLRPLDVSKGDTVLFSQYAGTKVIFNGEELQIINETDVMGIVAE